MTATAIEIRHTTTGDITGIVALWNDNAGPTRLAGGVDEATRLLERDPEALIVAVDHGVIVGTLIVGFDGWRCHLYRLTVRDDHRRTGVASRLLEHAFERARRLGAKRIDAMVDGSNASAIGFWETHGFELDTNDRRWSLLATPT